MSLGTRLAKRRNELHLTRESLAAKSKISEGSIFNYEKGARSPTAKHLARLARALEVSVSWLMQEPEGLINTLDEEDVVDLLVSLRHRPDMREQGILRVISKVLDRLTKESVLLRKRS
jgi:transcriptional regulator with XRE-family HTH domain